MHQNGESRFLASLGMTSGGNKDASQARHYRGAIRMVASRILRIGMRAKRALRSLRSLRAGSDGSRGSPRSFGAKSGRLRMTGAGRAPQDDIVDWGVNLSRDIWSWKI